MTFNQYKYVRIDLNQVKEKYQAIIDKIGQGTKEDDIRLVNEFFELSDQVESSLNIAYIRNTLNTKDKFYEDEMAFLDETVPFLKSLDNRFSEKLLSSVHQKALEEHFGSLYFDMLRLAKKTFSDEIIPLLQQENKLQTQYVKLISGAQIKIQEGTYNLSQMAPFTQSKDRNVRKEASGAISKWFIKNQKEFDDIYDKLVRTRDAIAKSLGYENFIQLGYDRLNRLDYSEVEVRKYRNQIIKHVVPLATQLNEQRRKRLNLSSLYSYDLTISFLTGNPTPKGNEKELVDQASKMYKEMSSQTDKFFKYLVKHQLMDLSAKTNKAGGGYCTYIPSEKWPFIFANFNQTAHDVDVLTHEAGHAFQVYTSKDLIPAYRWPTSEAAEIHSMSMEFLAYPWMEGFFKEDTNKYYYNHLVEALLFLPYGALVDEFQHQVYKNPDITPRKRRSIWRKLEKKYMPHKMFDNDPFLENGGTFFRQGHIFEVPFYYIDYTLAQVVAFEFWKTSRINYKKAFNKYLKLCRLGGSMSFVSLLKTAKLKSPFKSNAIKNVIEPIKEYLASIDDQAL